MWAPSWRGCTSLRRTRPWPPSSRLDAAVDLQEPRAHVGYPTPRRGCGVRGLGLGPQG